ncbi:MAG TPA: NAD(P)-binding protein [Euzebya sp.]|nr:NAD(P)-binding protein [Euzebya sp.]
MSARTRIAVLGGGPAGLSAACHLTDPALHPDWQDRWEVTVYQLGWRAGGKGASGRRGTAVPRPDGSGWALEGDQRIEEHGIHLFGNMYVNSMRMLKQCVEEVRWEPDAPVTTIRDSLLPSDYVQLQDRWDDRWHRAPAWLPGNDEDPWDPLADYADPAPIVRELLRTIEEVLTGHHEPDAGEHAAHAGVLAARRGWRARLEDAGVLSRLRHLVMTHAQPPATPAVAGPGSHDELGTAISALLEEVGRHVTPGDGVYAHIRTVWTQLELYGVLLKGVLADELLIKGIDTVDEEDYRDWFRRHGMSTLTLDANVVQMPALVCFEFVDGDPSGPPRMSASSYLMFLLRQVVARGHASYYFRVSTGETVIAPLYRTLVQRGVRFEFFSKVTSLEVDAAGTGLAAVHMDVQATVAHGGYDPLVHLGDGQVAWPDRPIYDQLDQGEELRRRHVDLESWWADWKAPAQRTLRVGSDVDVVISALPLPVLPLIAPDLPKVTGMDQALPGVATLAAQLWLSSSTAELGWPDLPGTDRVIVTGGVAPLGVADFSDSLRWEGWGADKPSGLLYLCGALTHRGDWPPASDHAVPALQAERVRAILAQWLRTAADVLPTAGGVPTQPGAFDLAHLWCPPLDGQPPPVGEERLDQQYWRANCDPNERYMQAPPGSSAARPQAWESGLTGLVLAGDWIFTGWNVPSFEAAVMSGMLASLTVTGSPTLEAIAGYGFLRTLPTPPPPVVADRS